jgi:hypothetical protein
MATKSVLEIFNTLIENDAKVIYAKNYNRITTKVVDKFNRFIKNEKPSVTSITTKTFEINEEKINFVLNNKVDGVVELNPREAKAVGLDKTIPCNIWRKQAYVYNGKVNIPVMNVVVPKKFIENMDFLEDIKKYSENEVTASINLMGRPIVNDIAIVNNKKLFDMVEKVNVAKIKYAVAEYLYKDKIHIQYNKKYTDEQIKLLNFYAINPKGEYTGIENVKEKDEVNGAKKERITKVYIKDLQKIPSVNQVLKDIAANKNLNAHSRAIKEEYEKQNKILDIMEAEEKEWYIKNLKKRNYTNLTNAKMMLIASKNKALLNNVLFNNPTEVKSKSNGSTDYMFDFDKGRLVINDMIKDVAI